MSEGNEVAYTPLEDAWIRGQVADPSIRGYQPPPCACIGSPVEQKAHPCMCELLLEARRRAEAAQ